MQAIYDMIIGGLLALLLTIVVPVLLIAGLIALAVREGKRQ
jgi:hypothetical protein|tara:strand:- start:87 stop:209 length:123 start_codon:yes stop_codon:yes gene_type:complete